MYEEGGKLTEAVRRRPYCLVLMDELEKAHPDVTGILLQIMEEGVLTDSTGRKVSFKNAIVVMTTNVGGEVRGDGLGFRPAGRAGETEEALRRSFTPEFLGRLDRVVHFESLSGAAVERIAQIQLKNLQDRVATRGIQLQLPEELPTVLGSRCGGRSGARQIRHMVQDMVEGPLAAYLLKTNRKSGRMKAKMENGELQFQ